MSVRFCGRAIAPALCSLCLAVAALFVTILFHPDGAVGAGPRLTIPTNQPALGLIYNGLSVGSAVACPGAYQIVGTTLCSHGPDAAPGGLDRATSVGALATVATATTPPLTCDGDGVVGNRLQVLYVRPQSTATRYAAALPIVRSAVAGVDATLNASAAETGGVRHLRLVTAPGCDLDVAQVTVSDATIANFGTMVTELQAQGYGRNDRKYVIFMDTDTYCGMGTVFQHDDRPSGDNPNNFGPSYARVDNGCWASFALAHEVMHLLGGVLASAPHGTANGHCTDAYDVLCYVDAPGVQLQTRCPANARQDRFDCNHDDYFSTNPPAGSYLATHWNAANNQFLLTTGPVASPSPSPTLPSPPNPPPAQLPSRDALCFPGFTQYCASGLFRSQWEQHGGLAINGYPLTGEFEEVLLGEDQQPHPFRVQYFERVRMEAHTDQQTGQPFVALGQFGRVIHPADPSVTAIPGAGFFGPTGHNVTRQAFLDYWNANGGLLQFGFPLTEEFEELLPINAQGDLAPFRVQYFERARFEWHPDNPANARVQLGQFGRAVCAEYCR